MRHFKSEIYYSNETCGDGCCSWNHMNTEVIDTDSGDCIVDESIETWNPYNEDDIQRLNDRIESSYLEYGENATNVVEFTAYDDVKYLTFTLTGR